MAAISCRRGHEFTAEYHALIRDAEERRMVESRVRVWLDGSYERQHLAPPPDDDTRREWEGSAICGASGSLRWVTPENVDAPLTCEACSTLEGHEPPLEGEYAGPP